MNLDKFVIMFDHQYILESVRWPKELVFINFQQESMTISEYEVMFTKLANFATTLDMDNARNA